MSGWPEIKEGPSDSQQERKDVRAMAPVVDNECGRASSTRLQEQVNRFEETRADVRPDGQPIPVMRAGGPPDGQPRPVMRDDVPNSVSLAQIMVKLNLREPLPTLSQFIAFDESIDNGLVAEMAQFVYVISQSSETVTEAVGAVMTAIMSKEVRTKYNGFGMRGLRNVNFSDTACYYIMEDVLKDTLRVTAGNVRSATRRWLSGANEQDGGRRKR